MTPHFKAASVKFYPADCRRAMSKIDALEYKLFSGRSKVKLVDSSTIHVCDVRAFKTDLRY